MAKTVAIVNQKGGVGKTTTTINLTACLAKAGESVLLIDMDPQANSTSGIGIDKMSVEKSVYDGIVGNATAEEILMETDYDDLFLLPSHYDLIGAEIELTTLAYREYRLKQLLEPIRNQFDYIVIDCPPSLGLLTINALCASDSILIPIQAEYFALEGVVQLMHSFDRVRQSLNSSLEIEGVLMTMCDLRTNLARQVIDEVKNHFGDKVYKTLVPRNIKIAESPGFGKPIVYYDIRSIGAEKYLDFTGEFIKANQNIEDITGNTLQPAY